MPNLPYDILPLILQHNQSSWFSVCTLSHRFAKAVLNAARLCIFKPRARRAWVYDLGTMEDSTIDPLTLGEFNQVWTGDEMATAEPIILRRLMDTYGRNPPRYGDIICLHIGETRDNNYFIYNAVSVCAGTLDRPIFYHEFSSCFPHRYNVLMTERGYYPSDYYDRCYNRTNDVYGDIIWIDTQLNPIIDDDEQIIINDRDTQCILSKENWSRDEWSTDEIFTNRYICAEVDLQRSGDYTGSILQLIR
jgi:hypothetical protein